MKDGNGPMGEFRADEEEFYNRVKIGDRIPSLTREAVVENFKMPDVFGGVELAAKSDEAQQKARDLGVDAIHTSRVFGGASMLQFISQMITNWLPNPRGWVQGGRLSAKFIGLVRFNDVITCKGQVKNKTAVEGRRCLVCEVWVENGAGEKVIIGEAVVSV